MSSPDVAFRERNGSPRPPAAPRRRPLRFWVTRIRESRVYCRRPARILSKRSRALAHQRQPPRKSKPGRPTMALQQNTGRIQTTHIGSLPRPTALLDIMKAKLNRKPYDEHEDKTKHA